MTLHKKSGFNTEIYYYKIIECLRRWKKSNKQVTREDLDAAIIKYLNVVTPGKVVKKLKDLGYISEEKKIVITILK